MTLYLDKEDGLRNTSKDFSFLVFCVVNQYG